jgi:hypothetical protein
MQFSVIQTRVSQRLNEAGTPVYYTAVEIQAAVNEGLRFFALLTLGLEQTSTWTPGATFTHMLNVFSNWTALLRISLSTGAVVRPATLAELAALDPSWPFDEGTSARYVSLGCDLVGLYGTSGTLTVTYARAPVPLVNPTDVPEIPAEYHPLLIAYGIYRCRQGEGSTEFAKALPYFNDFLDGAQAYATYVRSRNLGSEYETLPFELEGYDRSKLLARPGILLSKVIPISAGTVPEGKAA